MALHSFSQHARTLLEENTLTAGFESDTMYSCPVVVRMNGCPADALFLYHGGNGHPFAHIMIDAETGQVLLAARREACDFAPQLPASTSPLQATPLDTAGYIGAYQELLEVYESLRTFAYAEELSSAQQETVDLWKARFTRLAGRDHLPYYLALAPAFFDWLGMAVYATPDANHPGGNPEHQEMLGQLDHLTDLLERKLAADVHRDQQVEELFNQLQSSLSGIEAEPLERDVIKVIDDIGRSIESYRDKMPTRENYQRFFTMFEGIKTDLQDLLYRRGVEPFAVPGDAVHLQRQQILATTPTNDPKRDKTVALRHSPGWERGGKVIRPERVTVYVYTGIEAT